MTVYLRSAGVSSVASPFFFFLGRVRSAARNEILLGNCIGRPALRRDGTAEGRDARAGRKSSRWTGRKQCVRARAEGFKLLNCFPFILPVGRGRWYAREFVRQDGRQQNERTRQLNYIQTHTHTVYGARTSLRALSACPLVDLSDAASGPADIRLMRFSLLRHSPSFSPSRRVLLALNPPPRHYVPYECTARTASRSVPARAISSTFGGPFGSQIRRFH